MLQITEDVLKNLENTTSRSLVGEVCKLIEEIDKQNLPSSESLSLVKSLIRNRVYETFRHHTNLIVKFSEGVSFRIEFINPSKAE